MRRSRAYHLLLGWSYIGRLSATDGATGPRTGYLRLLGLSPTLDVAEQSWQLAEAFGLYTVPYSFTGQPAVSLPAAWVDGMPIGIQLVADHVREDVLFRIVSQLEQARPWADRFPPIS